MTNEGLLSPKEFATIYKISRDTLEYYNKIGLLSPCEKETNGYGLYSHEQGHTLQMIRLLKLGGCSLKEIRDMLYVHGASEFPDFMEQKRKMLEQRRDECETALRILDYYKLFRRTTLDLANHEMRIVKNPEQFYMLYTETDPAFTSDPEHCSNILQVHTRRCEARSHDVLGFPVGRIYSLGSDNKINMDSISGYCNYCIGVPDSMEDCRYITTTEYLTYLHISDQLTIEASVVEKVLSFVSEQGYSLTKDLYVIPFTEKIIGQSTSIYYCRIFAEVKSCKVGQEFESPRKLDN